MLHNSALPDASLVPHAPHTPSYGFDEAGRGCLAGPVVASVVLFSPTTDWSKLSGLDDSKKLTKQKRTALVPLILKEAAAYGIGLSWQGEVDAINIINATFRAMCRALITMQRKFPLQFDLPVYIDGNLLIREDAWQACAATSPSHWHAPYVHPLRVFVGQHARPRKASASLPVASRGDAEAFFPINSSAIPPTIPPTISPAIPPTISPTIPSGTSQVTSPATSLATSPMDALANSLSTPRAANGTTALPGDLIQTQEHATQEVFQGFPFTHQQAVIGGDGLIASISAASILAKTTRDALMERLAPYFPHYGFADHKGYGTKTHREALLRHGPCLLHRRSFITKILGQQQQLPLFP